MGKINLDPLSEQPEPDFEKPSRVFSSGDPRILREKNLKRTFLKENEQRVVDSYKIMVMRLANNFHPRFRNEGDRCRELDALALKFRSGWPWKNNDRLLTYGTPQLVSLTEALSKRVIDVMKCKKKGERTDVGKLS